MTLIEMEGFLKGKCLPGDLKVGETNAQYLYRKLNAVAELQRKLEALTAENCIQDFIISAVKELIRESSGVAGWHLNGAIASWDEVLPELNHSETPATDAALAGIRAQGVEMFISHMDYPHKPYEFTHGYMDERAKYFAQQLRKEADNG